MREMSKRMSQTEIVRELLAEAIPGGHDELLDDKGIFGPRDGLRGFERAEGAKQAGGSVVTMAVCSRRGECSKRIHHGHAFYYDRGFAGRASGVERKPPTFAAADAKAVWAAEYAASKHQAELSKLLSAGRAAEALALAEGEATAAEAESEAESDSVHM